MSDRKSFSVFNKLDEKYVEEADACFASPKAERKRRKDCSAEKKAETESSPARCPDKRSRRIAKRLAQVAACVLLLFVGVYFGKTGLLKSREEASFDGTAESGCRESAEDGGEAESGGALSGSQDGAASGFSENSESVCEGTDENEGHDSDKESAPGGDASSSTSEGAVSASAE